MGYFELDELDLNRKLHNNMSCHASPKPISRRLKMLGMQAFHSHITGNARTALKTTARRTRNRKPAMAVAMVSMRLLIADDAADDCEASGCGVEPAYQAVSYTHLTLPTTTRV